MSKVIDLSPLNVAKTVLYFDKIMLVKDFIPYYKDIECIEQYIDGGDILVHKRIYKWDKFKKQFSDRRILSVHRYDDTKTTSICLERLEV